MALPPAPGMTKSCARGARAQAGPPQGRLRIARHRRFDQRLQVAQRRGLMGGRPLPPRAGLAHPRHRQGDVGITLRQSSSDRRRREPRRAGHQRDAPVSEGSGCRRRPQAARPLSAGPHAWRGASREARVTVPRCFTQYKSRTTVILTVPNQARERRVHRSAL